jgi:DNA topoisomerase-1
MKPALYDVTTALIPTAHGSRENPLPYLFRAQGRVCVFDGFLKVYEERREDVPGAKQEDEHAENPLPPLRTSEALDLLELIPKQHWTKPPPRYTEASLIKELERRGIGRPSTYARMVAVIVERAYVRHEGKVLVPTELGCAVCDLLVAAFPDLFDYAFTAHMEEDLDGIARGATQQKEMLEHFWASFSQALGQAEQQMPQVQVERKAPEPVGRACPECGAALVRRRSKYGAFVGCSTYPKCTYVERRRARSTGQQCPRCGKDLILRTGKRGPFIGCSGYPACTYTAQATHQKAVG